MTPEKILAPTVPCEICSTPTPMLGTKRCDRCWELERRIEADPGIARRILGRLDHTYAYKANP